jgi:hypothetical protein
VIAQAVCLCPNPLQVVKVVTVLVHPDAELDVATHLQFSRESTYQYPNSVWMGAEMLTETWDGSLWSIFVQIGIPS